jgi:hypothetical protein
VFADRCCRKRRNSRGGEIERGNRHGVPGSLSEAGGAVEVRGCSRSSCGDLHEGVGREAKVRRKIGHAELRRGRIGDRAGDARKAERGAVGGGCGERTAPTGVPVDPAADLCFQTGKIMF